MKSFSDLLLDLYRLAQNTPTTEFQSLALDRMREVFAFDSAFWATGVVKPEEGVIPHAFHLYRQPPEMLESWMRINQKDELAFAAFRQQGTTINAPLCEPYWQSRFSPEGRKHIKRYGMAHSLNTIIAEPVLQIWMGVAFYRAGREQPFTEDERLFKQNLMPHLAETWNINRFAFLNSARNNGMLPDHGRAICDSKGVLYNADKNFTKFMLAEWPDWNGPQLPPELLKAVSSDNPCRHTGHRTVISSETLENMKLLIARETSAIDELSSREHEVASLFAKGANYRTIADTLHISSATVRNHLQNIYTKLGITTKIELARVMHSD
jgi:DNA-binding CsgD family transcriptional regulator